MEKSNFNELLAFKIYVMH